jgi:hypothetical protein
MSQEHYVPGVFSLTVQRLRRDRTDVAGRRNPQDKADARKGNPTD